MKKRNFEWRWTCAGCGAVIRLELEVAQATLDRHFNPATYLAHERNAMNRTAAETHAKSGCSRPV